MSKLTRCVGMLAAGLAFMGATSAQAQAPETAWSPIGPTSGSVLALQGNPFQPSMMLAGTYFGGMYRSDDYGHTWRHLATEFSTRSVFSIVFDPTVIGTIYVGTFQGGLYKSVDGGLSWFARNEGLPNDNVQAIAVSPSDPSLVIATPSGGGVYRSTDAGAHWTRSDDDDRNLRGQTIAFDPVRPGIVYLGTVGFGMFRSTNSGATWAPFNDGLPAANVLSLRTDRPTSSYLYAGTDNGVYKLTLATGVWRNITRNLQVPTFNDVLPHPTYPGLALAATNWGVFVILDDQAGDWLPWADIPAGALATDPSGAVIHVAKPHGGLWATLDFGHTWSRVDAGMQNVFVGAFGAVPLGSQSVLFAGTDFGIQHTSVQGWIESLEPHQTVFDLERHPTQPNVMFAGTEAAGVWKSTDAGQTWNASGTGIVPRQIHAIAETASATTLMGATSAGVYVSRDSGATWSFANTGTLTSALSAVADPTRDPIAYVGGSAGQVYRTGDAGRTFWPASNGLPTENVVNMDIAAWSTIYAVTGTGALFSSWDEGTSWQRTAIGVADPIRVVKVDPQTPWILYAGTHGGGVWKSESAGIEWAPRNAGLASPFVFSLTIDPHDPRVVYAGTLGRLYRSSDGATTWSDTGPLPAGAVTSVVLDPRNSATVFVSVAGAGMYRSPDRGATWARVDTGLPSSDAPFVLTAGELTAGRLYAGTSLNGMYVSSDHGDHWAPASSGMSLFVRGVAIDPLSPSTVYAGSLGDGVFKSTNSGASWTNVGLHDGQILKLAIDPVQPRNVYAATSEGVGVSRDAGATWATVGQKAPFVHTLVVDPSNPRVAYAGASGSILLKTTDGGETWSSIGARLPQFPVYATTIGPGGIIYASPERAGVFSSENGGATWVRIPDGAMSGQLVVSLARAGTVLYAATAGGGVFGSLAGAPWVASSNGLATPAVSHIVADPANPAALWASTFNATIFRSVDGGASWAWAGYGLTTSLVHSVTPDPSTPGRLFAATPDGLFVSTNGGIVWDASGSGLAGINVYAVTVAGSVLFAATNGKGVYKSLDGGATWTPSNAGLSNLDVRAVGAGPGALYAATVGGGVARSTDGGASWLGAVHAQLVNSFVLAVAVDPATPATIYAGTSGGGVLKSVNSGIDWTSVNNGLEHLSVLALAIDPVAPSTIYAGTSGGGVFVSFDAARHWSPLNNGLFNKIVTALEIDPSDHHRLYAGTEGGGAFAIAVPQPQTPTACTYTVAPGMDESPAEGETVRLTVTAPAGCRWTTQSHVDWLSVTSLATGSGSGAIDVAVSANLGLDARSGLVTVAGRPFVVVQMGISRTRRLTIQKTGHGQGVVQSDWPGIYCGEDCVELFSEALPVALAPQPASGSSFSGWSGDPDCGDGVAAMTGDRVCIARFEVEGDTDLDGLPDAWEDDFGLDPASAAGSDGADGDPDHDGLSNAAEYLGGSHPRGFFVRYFADGSTANGFDTTFALANIETATARVLLRFAKPGGSWSTQYARIEARRRGTARAGDVAGLGSVEFGTVVESDRLVVADRTVKWDDHAYGSYTETSSMPATIWYLIGGAAARGAGSELTYHLFNPGTSPATVTATYTLPATAGAIVKTYIVGAGARTSIRVGDDDSLLRDTDVWARLSASAAIVAEGSLLVNAGGQTAGSGAGAAGIGAPATRWYFADGWTETVFETELLLVNPNAVAAAVRVEYLLANGTVIAKDHAVAARARLVVNAASEDPLLSDAVFSMVVSSTNGVTTLAQRTIRWPETGGGAWYESHAANGSAVTGTSWALAEGEAALSNWTETHILIENTSASAGSARVRLLLEDGLLLERTFALPARSRLTVPVAQAFPAAVFKRFGAVVDSVGASPAQIVVERAMYSNSGGVVWAAGTSALAVRLAP